MGRSYERRGGMVSVCGLSFPLLECMVEVPGCADEGQVGERLGEVAELLAGASDLLGI
jgi:hypothetical protein